MPFKGFKFLKELFDVPDAFISYIRKALEERGHVMYALLQMLHLIMCIGCVAKDTYNYLYLYYYNFI